MFITLGDSQLISCNSNGNATRHLDDIFASLFYFMSSQYCYLRQVVCLQRKKYSYPKPEQEHTCRRWADRSPLQDNEYPGDRFICLNFSFICPGHYQEFWSACAWYPWYYTLEPCSSNGWPTGVGSCWHGELLSHSSIYGPRWSKTNFWWPSMSEVSPMIMALQGTVPRKDQPPNMEQSRIRRHVHCLK